MTDYTELKRLAEAAQEDPNSPYLPCPIAFMNAATPSVVLSLIAETEELSRYLCTCRDCGGEGAMHTGDWQSYGHMEPPEPVMEKCGECDGTGLIGEIQDLYQVITERDQLKAENEALRKERDARHPFKPFHEPEIGFTGCVICGVYTDHGGLPCPKTRATADAAMGKGEQS